jgi:hypothetical protein
VAVRLLERLGSKAAAIAWTHAALWPGVSAAPLFSKAAVYLERCVCGDYGVRGALSTPTCLLLVGDAKNWILGLTVQYKSSFAG